MFHLLLLPGRHGRGPTRRTHHRSAQHADRVRHLHHPAGGGPHAGPHDQHLHPAEHRNRMQPAQYLAGERIATRALALVHRDGLGLLDPAGVDIVPVRNCHPLLGQVLRPQHDGGLVRVHCPHPSAGHFRGLCAALLPVAHDAQIRSNRFRHPGAGDAQGTDRTGPPGSSPPSRPTVPIRADRLILPWKPWTPQRASESVIVISFRFTVVS